MQYFTVIYSTLECTEELCSGLQCFEELQPVVLNCTLQYLTFLCSTWQFSTETYDDLLKLTVLYNTQGKVSNYNMAYDCKAPFWFGNIVKGRFLFNKLHQISLLMYQNFWTGSHFGKKPYLCELKPDSKSTSSLPTPALPLLIKEIICQQFSFGLQLGVFSIF